MIWGTDVVINRCKEKFLRFVQRYVDYQVDEDERFEGMDVREPYYVQRLGEVRSACVHRPPSLHGCSLRERALFRSVCLCFREKGLLRERSVEMILVDGKMMENFLGMMWLKVKVTFVTLSKQSVCAMGRTSTQRGRWKCAEESGGVCCGGYKRVWVIGRTWKK